jgi:hypothetical protein
MTPYEMGKYAALTELGFNKDAGFVDWLKRVFGRTRPAAAAEAAAVAPKVRAPRRKPAGPTPDQVLGDNVRPARGEYTAPTEVLSAADEAALKAKGVAKEEEKGFLSKIPWWGKGLGLGAIGYGGYKMLAPPKQEEGMQPYYGPGNGRY